MALIKTFKQLQNDALRWFDEVDDQDQVRANVKQAIANAHVSRLSERSWPFMKWPEPVRFNVVPNQRVYTLHLEFFRPIYFYNVTQKQWMRQVTDQTFVQASSEGYLQQLVDGNNDWVTNTGSPYRFELRGITQIAKQPTSASVLTVSSSSTADGAGQKIRVRGELANGVVDEEDLACGTGGTAQAGSKEFVRIIRITKLADWSGTLTVTTNAGAVTVLSLLPSEYARNYQTIYLLSTPKSADTVEYHFYRQPSPLVEDFDVPDIPAPYQDILVYDALIDLAAYNPVEANALKVWNARQKMFEDGLLSTYGEALSLEREGEYTGYIPRE